MCVCVCFLSFCALTYKRRKEIEFLAFISFEEFITRRVLLFKFKDILILLALYFLIFNSKWGQFM